MIASPGVWLWAAIGLVAFIVSARAWTFLCDDAFISFRYAENLAEHGALVFNPTLPERVEGYTNFLWVVVLAVLHRLGVAPPDAAPALTMASAAAGLVALTGLVRALRRRFGASSPRLCAIDLVPAALLSVQPEYMVWAHSGLETSAATSFALAAAWAWTAGRIERAAILAAAAGLTRADALVPIAAFGIAWLVVIGTARLHHVGRAALREIPWRRVATATLLFVVPLFVHLLWRRTYYGQWTPNTWSVKTHGRLLRDTWGIAYVRAWIDAVALLYLAPLVVLLRPRHLLLVLPVIATLGWAWSVGGDFMAYSRFLQPATACLFGLVGWLFADAADRFAKLPSRLSALRHTPLVVALALLVVSARAAHQRWQVDRAKPSGWLDGQWEGVTTMDRFARVGWAVGRWMHAHLPADTLVTVGAAGAVPYGSRLPTLDAYGLVDPAIARLPGVQPLRGKAARPGHQLYAPPDYIEHRDPDLLCHVGYRGTSPPTARDVRRGYAAGYTWACITPDPEPSPVVAGGMLDVGMYCCRRPQARVVGPFGARMGS